MNGENPFYSLYLFLTLTLNKPFLVWMVFSSVLDEIEAGKNILPDSRQKYLTDPEENILPASDENISRIESENILENRKQSERSAKAFRFRANLLFVAA